MICWEYSKSPLLRTPLLWTAAYYGHKKNPRSVTFFNSVIKTPLLRTLLTDIRQLWTLFLVLIEENPSITYTCNGHPPVTDTFFGPD